MIHAVLKNWSFFEEKESNFINFFSQDDSKLSLTHLSGTFVIIDLHTSLYLDLRQQENFWGKDNLGFLDKL